MMNYTHCLETAHIILRIVMLLNPVCCLVLVVSLVHLNLFCSIFSQVTVVTSQPGRGVVHHLETGLKDSDLGSLRRLLVVQILGAGDWDQDSLSSEDTQTEGADAHINEHLHKITTHTVYLPHKTHRVEFLHLCDFEPTR